MVVSVRLLSAWAGFALTVHAAASPFDPYPISCNAGTGLSEPLRVCSPEIPCNSQSGEAIVTATDVPRCFTLKQGQPFHNDYPPEHWIDAEGTDRYACISRHPDATAASPRPLLIALHGGGSSADFVYNNATLRDKATGFMLSGETGPPGFHLASVQGRNIHFPGGVEPFSREGSHHDFYFREFSSPSQNPDVAFYDYLIDTLVAEGIVDPARIYIVGHSNGGFMAQAYGMNRHAGSDATPGGNRVAGVALFGSSDPFENIHHWQQPTCKVPYLRNEGGFTLPIFLVQRDCDAQNPCNREQWTRFYGVPGNQYRRWVWILDNVFQNPNVEGHLIDLEGAEVASCAAEPEPGCTPFRGTLNHITWPNGTNSASGNDWEDGMLQFLSAHPHPSP